MQFIPIYFRLRAAPLWWLWRCLIGRRPGSVSARRLRLPLPASERANTDVTGAGGSSARVRAQLSAGPPPGSLAVAVPVPWRVQRNRAGEIVALQNVGEVPLLAVRCCVAGPAFYAQTLPVDVAAGERIEPRIRLLPPEHSSSAAAGVSAGESRFDGSGHLLVVRWRDMASGGELLWSAPVL